MTSVIVLSHLFKYAFLCQGSKLAADIIIKKKTAPFIHDISAQISFNFAHNLIVYWD